MKAMLFLFVFRLLFLLFQCLKRQWKQSHLGCRKLLEALRPYAEMAEATLLGLIKVAEATCNGHIEVMSSAISKLN